MQLKNICNRLEFKVQNPFFRLEKSPLGAHQTSLVWHSLIEVIIIITNI